MSSLMDQVVNATEAAEHVNVARSLIDYWRNTGRLKPIGKHRRSLLYRLGDVIEVDKAMRDTEHSHRDRAA